MKNLRILILVLGLGLTPALVWAAGWLPLASGIPLGAIIDENFITSQYFPGPITSDLIDTRASSKFATNSNGLVSVGNNVLPIGTAGLLVEPTAINLTLRSQSFTNAYWNKQNDTTTDNVAVAPDGTSTASKSVPNTNASAAHGECATGQTVTNVPYTYSVYVKNAGYNFASIMAVSGNPRYLATVDLTTGAVTQNNSVNSPANISTTVTAFGNGWYLVQVSMTATTTVNGTFICVSATPIGTPTVDGFLNPQFTGDGVSGINMWGAQLELRPAGWPVYGSIGSSYIPTVAASVTRATDSIVIQQTGIGSCVYTFDNGTTQTVFYDVTTQPTIPLNLPRYLITRLTCYAAPGTLRQTVSVTSFPTGTTAAATGMAVQTLTVVNRMDRCVIVIPNVSGSPEVVNAGTLTATASIEYPIGTFSQIKFAGSASGSTAGALLVSDEFSVSAPVGSTVNVRVWGSSSNSTFTTFQNYASSVLYQTGAAVADSTLGGVVTNTAAGVAWGASVVACRSNIRAVAAYGDSITYGQGQAGSGQYAPNSGLFAPSLAATIAFANFGIPGDTLVNFNASHTTRAALATYFTSFVTNYGINDLANSRTGAQVIADRATMAAALPGSLIQSTITPSATSTDNFATAVNQTTLSYNAQRIIVNTNVRSLSSFIEATTPLEDGAGSGIWKNVGDASAAQATTATASPWLGVHPTSFAYGLVQSSGNVNPALFN